MFLYFLVDTSGSMDGAKIASVNDTMENIISELKLYSKNGDVKINVLSFARRVKWMYEQTCSIADFEWVRLTASGMTSLGNAIKLLSEDIEEKVVDEEVKILLISDGLPTDDFNEGVEILNTVLKNKKSNRFAIALEGADVSILDLFTGNHNNVFFLETLDDLMDSMFSTIKNVIDMPLSRGCDDEDEWS